MGQEDITKDNPMGFIPLPKPTEYELNLIISKAESIKEEVKNNE